MSARCTGVAVGVLAERVVEQVDVHPPGERVGDAQRRRGEVVVAHVLVDPALEVAVAREHRADDEVVLVDRLGDLLRQRPRVADAGRAAVADEVEAELVEVLVEPGALEVLGDHGRARRERGLHPRLALEPALDRLAGEQAGADHHRRVRGVGAAGDRGDHDPAVVELDLLAVLELDHHRVRLVLGDRREALALAAAARTPAGCPASPSWSSAGGSEAGNDSSIASSRPLPSASRGVGVELGQRLDERRLRVRERDPVLGALRAGDRRLDAAEVELERVGEGRVLGVLVVEHALLARVGVDELDRLGRAAGELEVAERLAVDREDRAGRAELRRHVADRRPVGEPERVHARGRRTRRTSRPRRARAASRSR